MEKSLNTLLRTQAYIDGAWVGEPRTPVFDKATGEEIARVPELGAAETNTAIEAAHRAFPAWSKLLAKERSKIIRRWYDLIVEHADELALLLTKEQGKPLTEARGEIIYGANFVELFAEEAKRVYGETIPTHKADARVIVMRQPIGVVGAITPWNFPSAMITRKVSPALAAGCTVVVKPAEDTPLSALALAELAQRAGIPKGVFNVVTAKDPVPVGRALTESPLVRMITFTGSTEVGKILMEQAARTVKRVGMELGGNAPFIVFDDADLDRAVAGALASKFRNAGQTCVCANRILVQDGVYDAFAEKLTAAVKQLKVGPGTEKGVTVGPLINKAALEKVEEHVADALSHGAKAVTGGKPSPLGGNFYEPTVLTGVTTGMKVSREETFGPVAPLFRFHTEEEAIRMANDTPFGLAAYFFTRDLGRCWRVAEALEYGIVGVNEGITSTEIAPFGGWKESGIGREGSHHGIEEFLEMKYTLMGGL
ncbi:NAD-dependent succinate-semialdehyde dehydrogenase [Hyphomicrobium sp. NDB2Meth4]|uniref:NAD-dependent succinate-semialdehyde dehydrogenase n=1 Tax=Hyphomicrobium sp. NDB2Meth4 TaxID=1892846 RepID=UPI0009308151|nr:NAD-dependent succinate-semialdehyde dehydrogenase [Hyphomicrobium sp. NDB2Meth4]